MKKIPVLILLLLIAFSSLVIAEEKDFFEEIEDELTEEELNEPTSAGITPDSPFYFIDEALAKLFGENREEKIAEIKVMIEKENYEAAKVALRKYEAHVDKFINDARPENRGAVRSEAVRIRNILKKIEQSIPEEYREEFIESVIENEKAIVTAVEIASKIKELCESLAELDPIEYSKICKTSDDAPNWQKQLDKELTQEQKEEAKKFGNIMAECFESSGEDCKCDEIPYPQFAQACSRAAPLAKACEIDNDEKACKKLDNFQMPRLPPHLEEVMKKLDGKVRDSKFDLHMPSECEGVTSPEECEKIMVQIHAPEECKEALQNVDNEREARKICDQIMMEKHSPECAEKGIKDPEECTKFMDSFRRDDFIPGPRIDFNCKDISDPTERLECFDKASSQAKGYKGHDDEDYTGNCMTKNDWKDKKKECRELYGQYAGDEPIMGDSGEGYECVIDAKCVDFGYKDDYVTPEDCIEAGALSKGACKQHRSDVEKVKPKCGDCESQCPGASRTDCGDSGCECYYEDNEPESIDLENECKDGCADECPGASSTSGCADGGSKCICHYDDEVSECANNGCSEKCGDRSSDCVDEKCVCFDYEDESDEEEETTDDDSEEEEDSGAGNTVTGNAFLDYWYS